jgi:hypothetical protein
MYSTIGHAINCIQENIKLWPLDPSMVCLYRPDAVAKLETRDSGYAISHGEITSPECRPNRPFTAYRAKENKNFQNATYVLVGDNSRLDWASELRGVLANGSGGRRGHTDCFHCARTLKADCRGARSSLRWRGVRRPTILILCAQYPGLRRCIPPQDIGDSPSSPESRAAACVGKYRLLWRDKDKGIRERVERTVLRLKAK